MPRAGGPGWDTSCTSSPLAPSRARAESLGHSEVTLVLVPPSLLQSLMVLCRETLLLCLAAAPQVSFCSSPGLLSCSESEKVTSGQEEKQSS